MHRRDKSRFHGPKTPFSAEEDARLLAAINEHGAKDWKYIATKIKTRTSKQCRERWHHHLNPSVNKGPWTPEEDQIIIEKQKIFGNKWAKIAQFLPGRTDSFVKNRWNSSLKLKHEAVFGEFPTIQPLPMVPISIPDEFAQVPRENSSAINDFLSIMLADDQRQISMTPIDFRTIPPLRERKEN